VRPSAKLTSSKMSCDIFYILQSVAAPPSDDMLLGGG
jgi:hypothetical protein